MRVRRLVLTVVVGVLLAVPAARADDPPPIKFDTVLPALSVPADGRPLADVLADVAKTVPEFHFILVRPPGVPADWPRLNRMQLTGLTVGQFLSFLNQYDDVSVKQVENVGEKQPPLFVISVAAPPPPNPPGNPMFTPTAGGSGGVGRLFAPPPAAVVEPVTEVPPPPARVRVVNLGDLVAPRVAPMMGEGDHVRAATDEVLSAVQAALDVAALPGPPATLRVHQPTLTLIARGTPDQLAVIEQTLNSLRPSSPTATNAQILLGIENRNKFMESLYRRLDAVERRLGPAPAPEATPGLPAPTPAPAPTPPAK